MLESFISLDEITKRPYLMFVWSFVLASISFFLASKVSFKFSLGGNLVNLSGIFSVIFIIIPAAYFLTNLINREEEREEKYIRQKYRKGIWERHEKDAMVFIFFFFGLSLAFAFWSFFLQSDFFQIQKIEIGRIIGVSGAITANATGGLSFVDIFFNNLGVVGLSFIFSLLFGAGVAFILVWNAGLLGVRIAQLSGGIHDIPIKSLPFLPHGIFEITSFVLAGLAGGLISAAIIREHHKQGVFGKVLLDAGILFAIALLFVTVGAWIEVQ